MVSIEKNRNEAKKKSRQVQLSPTSLLSFFLSSSSRLSLQTEVVEGLTNSNDSSNGTQPERHSSRKSLSWRSVPLNELLQRRVGCESDGGVGSLTEHLCETNEATEGEKEV